MDKPAWHKWIDEMDEYPVTPADIFSLLAVILLIVLLFK